MTTSTLTLYDLLRLAFSGPVTWLSGESKANCSVNWVSLSIENAHSGDLILLPIEELNEKNLELARSSQAAALLCLGVPTRTVPLKVDDFPIAVINEMGDLRAVERLLLTLLINQRALLMERGVRIHAQLSQLAAQGEGLDGLVEAMASISGHGILVQDKRLGILAQQPSSGLLGIWDEVINSLSSLENLPETLRDRKRAARQITTLYQEIPGNLARLIIPITVADVARGYLSLVSLVGELDALDQLVAEQGSLVCAIEMARTKAVRETEKRLKGDLLTALTQENLSPRDARLWAQTMGLDMEMAHTALRFAWDAPSPPSRRRLETLVNGEVAHQASKAIVSQMGTEVICFCQVPSNEVRPAAAIELGRGVIQQALRENPDIPARCGIGTPASDLSEWRVSFRQAGQALDMARRLGENKPLYFPDLSVYRLLLQIEHNPELIAFQEEILGPLLAYDGGLELIRTLEAYFEHNGNLSQTAEGLFIHRNTLIYRMERIAGITSLDLDKPETRLAVQLALHIYRMKGSPRI
jgi:PucR family transcriptional regulator, purine catabolism regulatory protein